MNVGAWPAASTAPITTTADLINTKKGRRVIGVIPRGQVKSAARERVDNDPGGLTGRDNVKITREIQRASHSRGGRLGTALDRPAFDDIPTADQVDLV